MKIFGNNNDNSHFNQTTMLKLATKSKLQFVKLCTYSKLQDGNFLYLKKNILCLILKFKKEASEAKLRIVHNLQL